MARNNSSPWEASVTDGDTSQDLRYAPPQAFVDDVATPGEALLPARRLESTYPHHALRMHRMHERPAGPPRGRGPPARNTDE